MKTIRKLPLFVVLSAALVGFFIFLSSEFVEAKSPGRVYKAKASWYGPGFHGKKMANGKRFNMNDPTVVAHKTLPFGTKLLVRNPETDRIILLTVQDRGPYVGRRELDVSFAAAKKLGMVKGGVVELVYLILPTS